MPYKPPADSKFLPLRFKQPRAQSWWAPVWRGLVVEPTGKHYRAMHTAVWLYLYLVVHADRRTGTLFRQIETIARDMGVMPTTVRRWFRTLSTTRYITRKLTGRAVHVTIEKWKSIVPKGR